MSETAPGTAPVQPSAPAIETTQQPAQGTTPANTSFAAQTPPLEGEISPPVEGSETPPVSRETQAEGEKSSPEPVVAEPPDYSSVVIPEGFTAEDPLLSQFLDAAKEKGVALDAAQTILDSLAPKVKEAFEAPFKEWQETQVKWVNEIRADPEIGGENVRKVQATIAKMLDNPVFCDPDLRRVMDYTGAGNNPAFVRSFYRMAQALSEAGPTATGRPVAPPRSAADVLYGNQSKGN